MTADLHKEWLIQIGWIKDCLENIYQDNPSLIVNEDGEGKPIDFEELLEEVEDLESSIKKTCKQCTLDK